MDRGKEFLEVWDIVSMLIAVYGVARILMEAPGAFIKLRDAYRQFVNRSGKTLDSKVANQLEDAMEQISETAEQAKKELNISTGGDTKGSGNRETAETGPQSACGKKPEQGADRPKPSLEAWPDAAEQARRELQRATERRGPVVINVGGKGEYPGAIRLF